MSLYLGNTGDEFHPSGSGNALTIEECLNQLETERGIYLQRPILVNTQSQVIKKEDLLLALPKKALIVYDKKLPKPDVAFSLPHDASKQDQRALLTSYLKAGTRRLAVIKRCYEISVRFRDENVLRNTHWVGSNNFLQSVSQFYNEQKTQLETFEEDIERLRTVTLDPALQQSGCRTMYDAIPEDQLREWKKDFEEDIKGLHNVLISATCLSSDTAMQAELEELNREGDRIMKKSEEGLDTVQAITQAMQQVIKKALDLMEKHTAGLFELMGICQSPRQYEVLFERLQDRYQHLRYPKEAPTVYNEVLKEIHRRAAFEKWFNQQIHNANKWARSTLQQEEEVRQQFSTQYGKLIPSRLVPSLRDLPPSWFIQLPEFARLPEIEAPHSPPMITYPSLGGDNESSASLEEENRSLQEQVTQSSSEIDKLKARINELSVTNEDLRQANDVFSQSSLSTNSLKTEHQALQQQYKEAQEKIKSLQSEMQEAKNDSQEQLAELKKQKDVLLENTDSRIQALQKEINALKEQTNVHETGTSQLNDQINQLREELEESKKTSQQLQETNQSLEQKLQESQSQAKSTEQLEKSIEELKQQHATALQDKETEHQQAIEEQATHLKATHDAVVAEWEAKLQAAQDEANELSKEKLEWNLEKDSLTQKLSSSMSSSQLSADHEVQRRDEHIRNLHHQILAIQNTCEVLQAEKHSLEDINQQLSQSNQELEKQLSTWQHHASAFKEDLKEERKQANELEDKFINLKRIHSTLLSAWKELKWEGIPTLGDKVLCVPEEDQYVILSLSGKECIVQGLEPPSSNPCPLMGQVIFSSSPTEVAVELIPWE